MIWDEGDVRFSATNLDTIVLAVVSVLQHLESTANQLVSVASFTVTLNEILASLEEATAAKWEVTKVAADEQIKIGQEKLRNGDLRGAIPPLIRAGWYQEGRGGNHADEVPLSNDMLGLPREDWRTVVQAVVREQDN